MNRYFFGVALVIVLFIAFSSKKLTNNEIENCLDYKMTLASLVTFSQEYNSGLNNQVSVKYESKDIGREVLDAWGAKYLHIDETELVYSSGKNRIDEAGSGDDITLDGKNIRNYCKNKSEKE